MGLRHGLSFVLGLLLCLRGLAADNLLSNASFEVQGSASLKALYWEWYNPDWHASTWGNAFRENIRHYPTNEGSWCASIEGDTSSGWWRQAPAQAGATYRASAWFWADNTWTANQQGLILEFYSGPGESDPKVLQKAVTSFFYDVEEAWTNKYVETVAPTSDWVRFVAFAHGGASVGALQLDQARLERVPTVRYVSRGGSNVWPFTSWATAATSIQAAISASYPGDVVTVTNGTYDYDQAFLFVDGPGNLRNRIALTNQVEVRSLNGPAVTTIIGSGPPGTSAIRCAYVGSNSLLSGFTLIDGCTPTNALPAGSGGGAWIDAGGRVSNCVIVANQAYAGGGVYCRGGSEVIDSVIATNTAEAFGGGVYCDYGGTVRGCTISYNVCDPLGYGGGVYCFRGGTVECSVVRGNTAAGGGGLSINGQGLGRSSLILENGATSSGGGGATCWGGGSLENCTIVNNWASNGWGGGVYSYSGTIYNTIVTLNRAADYSNYVNDASTFGFSCSQPAPGGTGNIQDDPLFVDQNGGNYSLATNSSCIDKGTNQTWMANATDLNGYPRLMHGTVDMGAYESMLSSWDTDADSLPDWWEWEYSHSLTNVNPASDDDADQLTNLGEYQHSANPTNSDTDTDAMADGWEVRFGTDPLTADDRADPDVDGFVNRDEYASATDPTNTDSYLHVEAVGLSESNAPVFQWPCLQSGRVATVEWTPTADSRYRSQTCFLDALTPANVFTDAVMKTGSLALYRVKAGLPATCAPTNGLLAYYPFDGNADDASGNTRHGTVTGATLTSNRFGRVRRAYSFDGSDHIQLPGGYTLFRKPQLTFAAWIYPTNTSGSIYWEYFTGTQEWPVYAVRLQSNAAVEVFMANSGSYATPSNSLPLNQWSFVATRLGDGETTNGILTVLINQNTYTFNAIKADYSDRTMYTKLGPDFAGCLDAVRVFTNALTDIDLHYLFRESQ